MLLRIYYVRDFPPHTLPLEIRKGYFMEPENKFATAEEKEEEEERGDGRGGRGGVDRSSQYQVVSKQRERDLRGAGPIFKKNDCIPLFLPFFSDSLRYVSNPCLVFLQKVCSANAFQKPFFKAQWNIAIEV